MRYVGLAAASCGFDVVAIEPFAMNQALVEASSCANGFHNEIKLIKSGLDTVARTCSLYQVPHVNIGDTHSVCSTSVDGEEMKRNFESEGYKKLGTTETTTLDELYRTKALGTRKFDILKIDVEGFESRVLLGGNAFFGSELAPASILIEMTSPTQKTATGRGGDTLVMIRSMLEAYGYTHAATHNLHGDGFVRAIDGQDMLFVKTTEPSHRRKRGKKRAQDTSSEFPKCKLLSKLTLPGLHANHEICVHPKGDLISDSIRRTGAFDRTTCDLIVGSLSEGDTFLDAGANIGAISLCVFARKATTRILSIEMSPWNFALLSGTHGIHDPSGSRWFISNAALDDREGNELSIIGDARNYGGSTAVQRTHHPEARTGWGEKPTNMATVLTTTMSQVMESHGFPCAKVIKIDVEGFEAFALQGMQDHFSNLSLRPCDIISEWHVVLLNTAGRDRGIENNAMDLGEMLRGFGYTTTADLGQFHESVHFRMAGKCCDGSGH